MLKRIQNYAQVKPFDIWLYSVAFLLTLDLTAYFVLPGTHNAGLFMMFATFAFSSPTWSLIQRLSDEQRERNPVALRQEQNIGLLSLVLACCSVVSLLTIILSKRVGLLLPAEAGTYLLVAFSICALLACGLGYAGRHTKIGELGFKFAVGWLASIVSIGYLAAIFLAMRHVA